MRVADSLGVDLTGVGGNLLAGRNPVRDNHRMRVRRTVKEYVSLSDGTAGCQSVMRPTPPQGAV